MPVRFSSIAASLWVVAASFASPAMAAAAAPSTRPASSEHDVAALLIDFRTRFQLDRYKTKGHRDPKWDADALALLPAEITGGIADTTDDYYTPAGAVPLADRVTIARRIAASGCDDAIVDYDAACALASARDPGSAALFARAEAAAPASPYLAVDQLEICRRNALAQRLEPDSPAESAALERMRKLFREAIADRESTSASRRGVWNSAAAVVATDKEKPLLAFGDAVEGTPGADPWIYHTFMGRVEINRAWHARGSGWANTVTDDGWKQFNAHLVAAREHFQKAIEADDTLPQPYAYMITVAMGESAGNERDWFGLAIERQCDYGPAYQNVLNALLPRWDGTHVQMLQVGIDAVAAGRFDTRAPAELLVAIAEIEQDMKPDELDARQIARVYPPVCACLDGYIARSDSTKVRLWARSLRAAWASRAGKWAEAQVQFAALAAEKAEPDPAAFKKFGLELDDVRQHAAEAAK